MVNSNSGDGPRRCGDACDVVPTGYRTAEMGGIQPGHRCFFLELGQLAAKMPWLFGAGRVIVIDQSSNYRLDFVRGLRAVRNLQLQRNR